MTKATLPDCSTERLVHELKNHLSVIVGFRDVLRDLPAGDAKRADVAEIQRAALAAVALFPKLPARMQSTNV